jgi:uncharacterized protein with HEPN domain
MQRDDAYLLDILESAHACLRYVAGKTLEDFSKDMLCQDAVIHRLEIIGEAAGKVSAETRQKYTSIPWQAMKSTRNVAIHQYDSIEIEVIWDIVQHDLPDLISILDKIIPPET